MSESPLGTPIKFQIYPVCVVSAIVCMNEGDGCNTSSFARNHKEPGSTGQGVNLLDTVCCSILLF